MKSSIDHSPTGYAAFRIVREPSGDREPPRIDLPPSSRLYTDGGYSAISDSEFYAFVDGTLGAEAPIAIDWPGAQIVAVVCNRAQLPVRREGGRTLCEIPLHADTLRRAWPTLEVWSHFPEENLHVRIEHNQRGRRAGYYAACPWVGPEANLSISYLFAARTMLRDWGLHHQIASDGLGILSLMGFETNNLLHKDHPPHWHLIHYWPGVVGTQVPHLYFDSVGRITSNTVTVHNDPDEMVLGVGEAMTVRGPGGTISMILTIRPDGGLDIGPAENLRRYALIPHQQADQTFIRVEREGTVLSLVRASDDADAGRLRVSFGLDLPDFVHHYDPLTGIPRPQADCVLTDTISVSPWVRRIRVAN